MDSLDSDCSFPQTSRIWFLRTRGFEGTSNDTAIETTDYVTVIICGVVASVAVVICAVVICAVAVGIASIAGLRGITWTNRTGGMAWTDWAIN